MRVGGVVGDDERLADQRVEVPEHVDVVGAVDDRADARRGRSRRRTPTSVRSSVALVVGQQVVRPLDRVAERELALRARRRPLQQPEPVGEPIPDLDRAHGRHARGGQLDAEREPVERSRRSRSPRRRSPGRRSPKSGRTARARSTNSVTASEVAPPSSASGGTASTVSPSTAEGLARRGEDLDVPGPAEDRRDRRSPRRRGRARSCRPRAGAAGRPAPRRPCR